MSYNYPIDRRINGLPTNAFPYNVDPKIMQEYYPRLKFKALSDVGDKQVFVTKFVPDIGGGLCHYYSRMDGIDITKYGSAFQDLSGIDQKPKTEQAYVLMDKRQFNIPIDSYSMVNLGSALDHMEAYKTNLIEGMKRLFDYEVIHAMTRGLYPDFETINPTAQTETSIVPCYDRVVMPTSSANKAQPTRAAYYNNAANNIRSIFATYANQANTSYNTSGMSCDLLNRALNLANIGTHDLRIPSDAREPAIGPSEIKIAGKFQTQSYIFLMHPMAYDSLIRDPLFSGTMFTKGYSEGPDQASLIYESEYLGKYREIRLFKCKELADITPIISSGAADVSIGWNLLLGRAAQGWVFTKDIERRAHFGEETTESLDRKLLFIRERRGISTIMFPSKYYKNTPVESRVNGASLKAENGVIHVFCSLN